MAQKQTGWFVKPAAPRAPHSQAYSAPQHTSESADAPDFAGWAIGNMCEALYSDGKYYDAQIVNLRVNSKGRPVADVLYRGFEEDGAAGVKLSRIRQPLKWREKKDIDTIGVVQTPRASRKRPAPADWSQPHKPARSEAPVDSDASTAEGSEDESVRRDRRFLRGRDDDSHSQSQARSGPSAQSAGAAGASAEHSVMEGVEYADGGKGSAGDGSATRHSAADSRAVAVENDAVARQQAKRRRYELLGWSLDNPSNTSTGPKAPATEAAVPAEASEPQSAVGSDVAKSVGAPSPLVRKRRLKERPAPVRAARVEVAEDTEEKPQLDVDPQVKKEPFVVLDEGKEVIGTVPAPMNQYLRDYQREGAAFLLRLFAAKKGGVLGDDMGLGKTVQVICFLAAICGKKGDARDKLAAGLRSAHPPILIVAPVTLLRNWQRELNTWGYFEVAEYHGNSKDRDRTMDAVRRGVVEVVLTSYELLRDNVSTFNQAARWLCIIADEAHRIKNPDSKTTIALKKVSPGSPRYALTGTAVQNTLMEFWCLLDWTNPGDFLTENEFEARFVKTIGRGQRSGSTEAMRVESKRATLELKRMTDGVFLRRTKALIASQLPQKVDKVVFCRMSGEQTDLYRNIVQLDEIRSFVDEEFDGSDSKREIVLSCIQWLQKLSQHPKLLLPEMHDSEAVKVKMEGICDRIFVGDHLVQYRHDLEGMLLETVCKGCGKMKVLEKLLADWDAKGNSKVLIFSFSLKMLDLIGLMLDSKGYSYGRLDGTVPTHARMEVIDHFNTSNQLVFLISTRVGGVGLNLTSANVCVIYDPNWNPAHDLQAQDRTFRIGQRRDVTVYRLISSGSIEELVYARQIYKQQLANIGTAGSTAEYRYFNSLPGDRKYYGELFGVKNLFSLDIRNLTKQTINRAHETEHQLRRAAEGLYDLADYQLKPQLKEDDGEGTAGEGDAKAQSPEDYDVGAVYDDAVAAAESEKQESQRQERQGGGSQQASQRSSQQSIAMPELDGLDVDYSHTNSRVLRPSRMEAQFSRAVERDMDDVERGGRRPRRTSMTVEDALFSSGARGGLATVREEGGEAADPPGSYADRRSQLARMAGRFGYTTLVDFAQHVINVDGVERRRLLDVFYAAEMEADD